MFSSTGNHLLRAALADSAAAPASVEEAIRDGYYKVLVKIMSQVEMTDEQRDACFAKAIAAKDLEAFTEMHKAANLADLSPAYLRVLIQLDAAGWEQPLEKILGAYTYTHASTLFNALSYPMPEHLHDRILQSRLRTVSLYDLATVATRENPARLMRYLDIKDAQLDANKKARLAYEVLSGTHAAEVVDSVINALIERGMNVNYDNGAVMLAALRAGRIDIAQKLIDEGLEPALVRTHVYENLCATGAPRASLDFAKSLRGATPAAVDGSENNGFTRSDEHSVACVQSLPGNGKLTMVFNFATAQQIVIAQIGEQIAAPAVVEFSRLESRALLDKAAEAYVALGGDAALAAAAKGSARKPVVGKPSTQAGN